MQKTLDQQTGILSDQNTVLKQILTMMSHGRRSPLTPGPTYQGPPPQGAPYYPPYPGPPCLLTIMDLRFRDHPPQAQNQGPPPQGPQPQATQYQKAQTQVPRPQNTQSQGSKPQESGHHLKALPLKTLSLNQPNHIALNCKHLNLSLRVLRRKENLPPGPPPPQGKFAVFSGWIS